MSFDETLRRLEISLEGDLPGAAAHALMAPRPRRNWPPGFSIERIRHAAGLLLLFPLDDQPHIVLTVRAQTLDRHGGQVSLPGGVIEAGETYDEAAFREAQEEIGLPTGEAERLGGFCLLLRRTVLQRVSFFDEQAEKGIFDADALSWRIRQSGYHLACCRDLFIHHFGSRLAMA